MANIFDLFKQISTDSGAGASPVEYIVVGLGNPGLQYEKTRHNAGFILVDALARRYSVRVDRARYKSLVAEANISGRRVLLMKPQTFMNLSGEAVGEAVRFFKLDASRVIVLSDDISLDVGKLRVRRKGSAGGHNGLKDIIAHLGSDEFMRIKIGVGAKPHPDYDLKDWVLGKFSPEQAEDIENALKNTVKAVNELINRGIDSAMNKYSK